MPMKQIEIFQAADNRWYARFHDDDEVMKLFGTTILPTPFSASTPYHVVATEIRRRNPDCEVSEGYRRVIE